jgi:retron-type reverse transcriptase
MRSSPANKLSKGGDNQKLNKYIVNRYKKAINLYANNLMEKILAKDNMNQAYKRVVRNKGKHGIDGMTVDELLPYLKENGNQLRKDILQGKYKPKSVRRAEISKSDRVVRLLGIPTVIDRMIQQAIAQQLT